MSENDDDLHYRKEWDLAWRSRTQRQLPAAPQTYFRDIDLFQGPALGPPVAFTISDDPPEFAGRIFRQSEICPVCGHSTAGQPRVAASMHLTFEIGFSPTLGVWAHTTCFEQCPDTGQRAPIPW